MEVIRRISLGMDGGHTFLEKVTLANFQHELGRGSGKSDKWSIREYRGELGMRVLKSRKHLIQILFFDHRSAFRGCDLSYLRLLSLF